jgi:hypothetical protein
MSGILHRSRSVSYQRSMIVAAHIVMAGLVLAIHVFELLGI